jgi:hypothetical protein
MNVVEAVMSTLLRWIAGGLFAVALVVPLLAVSVAHSQEKKDKDKLELDKIPKKVMDTLMAKFPKAEIHKWTKEKEGDVVVYDFEFKQEGRKFEADIKEDGTIHNWEKEVAVKDVPDAVKKAVEKKYAKSNPKEIMQITAVKNGKEELEGYEIVLETAGKKEVKSRWRQTARSEDSGGRSETDHGVGANPFNERQTAVW